MRLGIVISKVFDTDVSYLTTLWKRIEAPIGDFFLRSVTATLRYILNLWGRECAGRMDWTASCYRTFCNAFHGFVWRIWSSTYRINRDCYSVHSSLYVGVCSRYLLTCFHISAVDAGLILLRYQMVDLGALVVARSYRSIKPGFEEKIRSKPGLMLRYDIATTSAPAGTSVICPKIMIFSINPSILFISYSWSRQPHLRRPAGRIHFIGHQIRCKHYCHLPTVQITTFWSLQSYTYRTNRYSNTAQEQVDEFGALVPQCFSSMVPLEIYIRTGSDPQWWVSLVSSHMTQLICITAKWSIKGSILCHRWFHILNLHTG